MDLENMKRRPFLIVFLLLKMNLLSYDLSLHYMAEEEI